MRQAHHLAMAFIGQEDVVAHGANVFRERHHQLLADGVDGRIGDLGKLLTEIVEQQLRSVGEHGQRRVVAHRSRRLAARGTHRDNRALHVFPRIAESAEPAGEVRHGIVHLATAFQRIQLNAVGRQPLAVWTRRGQLLLQLAVVVYLSLLRVNHQYLSRLQAAFRLDGFRVETDDARLARHHHRVILRNQVAGRTQPVAVEHSAGITPVAEKQGGRAVPRLHEDGVIFIERLQVFTDGILVVKRLGHEHRHGMGQA